MEYLSFSSLVRQYQPILQRRLLSHPPGVLLWQGGLRLVVIRLNFSTTTRPSSILPSGMFCFLFLIRRAALNELCVHSGDWASGVWSSSGIPGQEQSCAARTGYATCQDFVQNSGGSFQEACESLSMPQELLSLTDVYPSVSDWEIISYKRYQLNST